MRFLTPVLFAAAGAWVAWSNAQHSDRVLVLPFLDALDPAVANDPAAQGALTVKVLLGLAAVFAVWDLVMWLRARRADGEPPAA
jgi:hypothetical protein